MTINAAPPPSNTVTVSADGDYYTTPTTTGWWALQNSWGRGNLVNGVDYTQTVTVTPSTFPDGTVLSWNWPNTGQTSQVYGYPEVIYGAEGGIWAAPDGGGPTPVQIDNLTALTGSFDISIGGATDSYDVLWETQLTSAPDSGQVDEFGIMLHTPSYFASYLAGWSTQYAYNQDGLSATVYVGTNGSYPYILVDPTQGDMLTGTVNIQGILDFVTQKGVLTGKEYIEGFELGAEPVDGSGTLTVNSIGYDWNGTVVGTMPSNTVTLDPSQPSPTVNLSNVDITGTGSFSLFIGGTDDAAILTGGTETVQAYQGYNTITTVAGNDTIKIGGQGNVVDARSGSNSIYDSGSANTIVMPQVGHGTDKIYGAVFQNGDTMDLRSLLGASQWDGSAGTVGEYLKIVMSGKNAILEGRDTTSSRFHAVATFENSGALNLSQFLTHAVT